MSTRLDARLIVEAGIANDGPISLTKLICVLGKSYDIDSQSEPPFVSRRECHIRFQDETTLSTSLTSQARTVRMQFDEGNLG